MHPVAIIGAGPTGLAAALTLAQRQIPLILYERAQVGGQLRQLPSLTLLLPPTRHLHQLLARHLPPPPPPRPLTWNDPLTPHALWSTTGRWRSPIDPPIPQLRLRLFTLWWRAARRPHHPLAALSPLLPSPLRHLLHQLMGETLETLTWARLSPLLQRLFFPYVPPQQTTIMDPSEWFAIPIARALGKRAISIHTATPIHALHAVPPHWYLSTPHGRTPPLSAVILTLPPREALRLLPPHPALSPLAQRLTRWPYVPRWNASLPLPHPILRPLQPLPRLWLAGEWLPPLGALPGLDAAVASGVYTARALLRTLL
ncbi:MAG: hypothetical protein N2557_03820 [Hydrogenophilus sp.]|nr:hypothetical protein [Hydrogenophilus sp.]